MSKRKPLLEMYVLREDQRVDDFNKSLSGGMTSLVKPSGGPKPRVGADGTSQKTQVDLDQSKSIFDEAAGAGDYTLSFTKDEINSISSWAHEYNSDSITKKINDLMGWEDEGAGRDGSPAEYDHDDGGDY